MNTAETLQSSSGDFGRWHVPDCPVAIEYSLVVLEELRRRAEEFFQKIPHGGLEIGAVLLGERAEGVVRILEWRPIECEHAKGPGFILSEKDLTGLRELLGRCGQAVELQGLEPVGWFHTHTRSNIHLSAEDQAIFDSFFPERWQVALVMQLVKNKPQMAGFFFRGEDSRVQTASSANEFVVSSDASLLTRPRRKTAAPSSGGSRASAATRAAPVAPASTSRPESEPAAPREAPKETAPQAPAPWVEELSSTPGPAAPAQERSWVDRFAETAPTPQPRRQIPRTEPLSSRLLLSGAPRSRSRSPVVLAVAVLALLIAGVWAYSRWFGQRPAPSFLRVQSEDDQLIISWDQNAPVARTADRGTLHLSDGPAKREVPLSPEGIRRGSITYRHRANDVEVQLTLFQGSQPVIREYARFLGSGERPDNTVDPAPPAIEADLERLKVAIEREKARGKKLADSVRAIERRRGGRDANGQR
jgi:hypothetical protein